MKLQDKKAALIKTIEEIQDERILNQIIIASKKDLLEGMIDSYLKSGANGDRVMYPDRVRNNLFSILLNSNVSFEEVRNFLDRVKRNEFASLIRKTLFGNTHTSFETIKACDPFVRKTFQKLLELVDGVGTTGAMAGKGEFLFIMLGADKGDVGDVLFEGEMAEVKGAGAKIVFGRQGGDANAPGWKDNNVQILKQTAKELFNGKMTWSTGSPLTPGDVADFFDLNKNPDSSIYNLENFIKLHEVYLPKVFPSAGQIYIDKAIHEMKNRFKTTLDTGVYTDIMVKMGFQQYLSYGRSKKLRSVLYFSEADQKFISIEDVKNSAYANSDYFTVTAGYLGARPKMTSADRHKVINLTNRDIQTRKKLNQTSASATNKENAKKASNARINIQTKPKSDAQYVQISTRSGFNSPIPLEPGQKNKVYHYLRVAASENGHYGIVHEVIRQNCHRNDIYGYFWKRISLENKSIKDIRLASIKVIKEMINEPLYRSKIPFATKKYFEDL